MKHVCTYSRYSNAEVEQQRWPKHHQMITNFLEEHKDYDNLQNFVDINIKANNGITTKDDILEMAKLGKLDMLLVPTVSMLGRDTYEAANFVKALHDNGCEVYFIQERMTANADAMLYRLLDTFPQYIPHNTDYPSERDVLDYLQYVDNEYDTDDPSNEILIRIGESEITLPMNEDNYNAIKTALEDIAEHIGLEQTM